MKQKEINALHSQAEKGHTPMGTKFTAGMFLLLLIIAISYSKFVPDYNVITVSYLHNDQTGVELRVETPWFTYSGSWGFDKPYKRDGQVVGYFDFEGAGEMVDSFTLRIGTGPTAGGMLSDGDDMTGFTQSQSQTGGFKDGVNKNRFPSEKLPNESD
ncbi:MAG: hypothetical protein GY765_32825 [bacterium]|nr:hypothetical protein [bacterium]